MNKCSLALLFLCALPLCLFAQESDIDSGDDLSTNAGMWIEAGVSKKLSRHWTLAAEVELRMDDNPDIVGRFSAGASLHYKPAKWLKLGAGYSWLYGNTPEKTKQHYKTSGKWNGYNVTDAYWSSRQRIMGEMTFSTPRLFRWIRLSLRERYQFTWRGAFDVDRTKYRFNTGQYFIDGVPVDYCELRDGYPEQDKNHKEYTSNQHLRSRVKIEMDRKRIKYYPYVSYELYNDLEDNLRIAKMRLAVGLSHEINRHNEIGCAYLFCTDRESEGNKYTHIIAASYNYKF